MRAQRQGCTARGGDRSGSKRVLNVDQRREADKPVGGPSVVAHEFFHERVEDLSECTLSSCVCVFG